MELDMDIEDDNELMEEQNKVKLAAEINMVKQMSEEMLAGGAERMKAAKSGDAVDKYMNHDKVQNTIKNIERKYSIDAGMDAETVKTLEKKASKEQYKAMKDLNKLNERASPKMIAKRRQSLMVDEEKK